MVKRVILKPGRERPILEGHPWIFSGAIEELPDFEDGSILEIYSSEGNFLAMGCFNRKTQIAGRVLTRKKISVQDYLNETIARALELRRGLFDDQTNAYRLINSEGDGIPGFIADKYSESLCIQIGSAGAEKLKPQILEILIDKVKPRSIYEKSLSESRILEGLEPFEGWIYGPQESSWQILENGLHFEIFPEIDQKTGFFLDQRSMRSALEKYAARKSVLNCFAYTGGFSLYAVRGGAASVDSVDISSTACERIGSHLAANQMVPRGTIFCEDVFHFFERIKKKYDLIVLDPPAFAKKRKDLKNAYQGYLRLHKKALGALNPGGILFTSSCSYFFQQELFEKMAREACSLQQRTAQILSRQIKAPDHPVLLAHPEGEYLKSLILRLF